MRTSDVRYFKTVLGRCVKGGFFYLEVWKNSAIFRYTLRNKTQLMTRKERFQRVNLLKQQLTLIQLYYKNFEDVLGKKRVDEKVDNILDEINIHLKELAKRN